MKKLLILVMGAIVCSATTAVAAEWVKVAENPVSDRFFVDKGSIQRQGDTARYWEYREFQQPNTAFLEEKVDQPVYGVVMGWTADCKNNSQHLRQITAYNKERKVIKKFSYGAAGKLLQAQPGSSASKVVEFVCAPAAPVSPQSGGQPARSNSAPVR